MAARKKAEAPAPVAIPRAVREAVRAAEAAAQRSQCRIPASAMPAELAEALEKRVAHNIATTGGRPLQSCGGADPDVQRLEAPYRPQPAEADSDEQPPSALDLTINPEGER